MLDAQQGCQLGCKTLPNFFDTFEMQNPPKNIIIPKWFPYLLELNYQAYYYVFPEAKYTKVDDLTWDRDKPLTFNFRLY